MEYEIYVSGIGGQGVQLVAKVLAVAGIAEDRHAMLSGFYGHEMRGGPSLATCVLGNAPLRALPVTARVHAAMALHHHFWDRPLQRLVPDALIFADEAIAEELPAMPGRCLVTVPATRIAMEAGNPMAAGMAMLGAFSVSTGLVATDNLVAAMRQLVPSYRRQHLETNERAIRAGAMALPPLGHPVRLDDEPDRGIAA